MLDLSYGHCQSIHCKTSNSKGICDRQTDSEPKEVNDSDIKDEQWGSYDFSWVKFSPLYGISRILNLVQFI